MELTPQQDGTFLLGVAPGEAEVLHDLVDGLAKRLRDEDVDPSASPELRRLNPPAHPDDVEDQRAYEEMLGSSLAESRLADLDVVAETLEGGVLQREQLEAWLRSLNALRLVLGTVLDIDEDADPALLAALLDDRERDQLLLYEDLGLLVGFFVHALTSPLPPP